MEKNILSCYSNNHYQLSLNLKRLYDIDINNLFYHAICMTFGYCTDKQIICKMDDYVFNNKILELTNNKIFSYGGNPFNPIKIMHIFRYKNYIPTELLQLSDEEIFPIPLSLSVQTKSKTWLIEEEIYFFDLNMALLVDKAIKDGKYKSNIMPVLTKNNLLFIGETKETALVKFEEEEFKRKKRFDWHYNHSLCEWAISGLSHSEITDREIREREDRNIGKREEKELDTYIIKTF